MKYLNSLQDRGGRNVSVDGHKHTKSEVIDFPTKLSQLEDDIGIGTQVIVSNKQPTGVPKGTVWI